MKGSRRISVVTMLVVGSFTFPALAWAAGIFNTPEVPAQAKTVAVQQEVQSVAVGAVESAQAPVTTYQPVTPPPASVAKQITADPKLMEQFDRKLNEDDSSYINRMKTVAQKSADDMAKASADHIELMKSLAPK